MATPDFKEGDVVIAIKDGVEYRAGIQPLAGGNTTYSYCIGCKGIVEKYYGGSLNILFLSGERKSGCSAECFAHFKEGVQQAEKAWKIRKTWAKRA